MADEAQKEKLARAIARWQNCNPEGDNCDYLKNTCFDRWRQYVKMRKLVGYILNNMENWMQPYKADLSWAFNKWKYYTGDTKQELTATTRHEQQTVYVNNVRNFDCLFNFSNSIQLDI